MKKIILFLLLSTLIIPAMAQSPISLGLKAGYNTSKLTTDVNQFKQEGVNNFLAGAFLRVNLGKIYLQPEAYFNSKGGKLEYLSGGPVQVVNEFDFNTVDVPVLLGLNVINKPALKLRANAGPLLSFFTDKKLNSDFNITSDQIKDNFFGWQYGVGVDVLFFTLDVRMENSTGNLYTGPQIENTDLNAKSKSFIVSLGIKIL